MKWIKALGAFVVLAALVLGPPALLIGFVGNPWPAEGVSLMVPLTDGAVIGVLAVILWLFWAQMLVCIVVEAIAVAKATRLNIHVPATFGFQQHLAQALVAAVVLVLAGGTMTSGASHATTTTTAMSATPSPVVATNDTTAEETSDQQTLDEAEQADEAPTLTVHRGDTLWSLADKHLGDGERWKEIAGANEGKQMRDGGTFRGSAIIQPGWELQLPGDATLTDDIGLVTIEKGDTLSQIALDELGDASKYPEIFEASKDITQPGGWHLSNPDVVEPGWIVRLPGQTPAGAVAPQAAEPRTATSDSHLLDNDATHEGNPSLSPRAIEGEAIDQIHTETPTAQAELDTATDLVADSDETGPQLPGWVPPGLLGGGTLLAGSLLLALRRRRASQHRTRRPGRTITAPDPQLTTVEKSVTVAGSTTATTVELVDELLRRLAGSLVDRGEVLPDLAAVEVTDTAVAIHLKYPAATPAVLPWAASDDGLLWVVDKDVDLEDVGPDPLDRPAPWPLLVTIGQEARGGLWLLNIEDLNVEVTGDPIAVGDFARFVAAEVACNPWSKHTALDVVGIAGEVATISPDRIHAHDKSFAVAAEAVAEAVDTIDRLTEQNTDTPTARARQDDPDPWPSRLVIVGHPDGAEELAQLIGLVRDHHGRSATSLVLTDPEETYGFKIHIDDRRRLTLPAVNLTVKAVGLTVEEVHGCSALLAQADDQGDSPVPDLQGDEAWQAMATATGSLRDQYRVSRQAVTLEDSGSVLGEKDEAYTSVAATTTEDLEALAPKVTASVRQQVAEADPNLDADLEQWYSETCARPRLTMLGPVSTRASGIAQDKRKPFYTELLAYLVSRPHGATTDEVATAFDITAARVRIDINKLRDWLGTNPATGEKFLPDARKAPAAQTRGAGVYQVVDALVDAELFLRLRVRSESRGADGIGDLVRALQLVKGRPFDQLRGGGWGWFWECDRKDLHMVCAIADVAHVVVTHSLHAGDLDRARTAVGIAMMAAPDEEIARLDLAAVLEAQGHGDEAERIVRDDVCNRSDDGEAPTELPVRTEQIIDARRWLHRAAI